MNLGTLGEQPFAAVLAATGKTGATGFGAHARAKTVLIFPGALRALESAFHNRIPPETGEERLH
jgi:hypothetical protein